METPPPPWIDQPPPPRRRGRPRKPIPLPPAWIVGVNVALRCAGVDPETASIDEVTEALNPHRRSARLPWTERVLLPITPVVVDLLGVSKGQIYRLAHEKKLDLVRLGGRSSITSVSVKKFLEESMQNATKPLDEPPQLKAAKRRRREERDW